MTSSWWLSRHPTHLLVTLTLVLACVGGGAGTTGSGDDAAASTGEKMPTSSGVNTGSGETGNEGTTVVPGEPFSFFVTSLTRVPTPAR